ncbi:UNVERIFIED_CONTAM: hypothetical protein Slati_0897000 [Sesamum latifolium]|uniref:Uncharacterized protein n=1 Tax=Sesamum latifolium TaxID=2727402 RepID=A0AAW2XN66_9LAMI
MQLKLQLASIKFSEYNHFRESQLEEYGDGEFGMSDELSLLALNTKKAGHHDVNQYPVVVTLDDYFTLDL